MPAPSRSQPRPLTAPGDVEDVPVDPYPCPEILDRSIANIEVVVGKPWYQRLDLLPFVALYLTAYYFHVSYDDDVSLLALIAFSAIIFVHVLLLLSEYWFVHIRIFIGFRRVPLSEIAAAARSPNAKRRYLDARGTAEYRFQSDLSAYNWKLNIHKRQQEAKIAADERRKREIAHLPAAQQAKALAAEQNRAKGEAFMSKMFGIGLAPAYPKKNKSPFQLDSDDVYVHVVPEEHAGAPVLCPLSYDDGVPADIPPLFFHFHHFKYYLNHSIDESLAKSLATSLTPTTSSSATTIATITAAPSADASTSSSSPSSPAGAAAAAAAVGAGTSVIVPPRFEPLAYPDELPLVSYAGANGINSPTLVAAKLAQYGPNSFEVPPPTFKELFIQHAMAPFFVFQLFCISLWLLDEYWYYSLFTLVMLVIFESTVVSRRLGHFQDLVNMRPPPHNVFVYRQSQWIVVSSDKLVPGDIISVTRAASSPPAPSKASLAAAAAVNAASAAAHSTDTPSQSAATPTAAAATTTAAANSSTTLTDPAAAAAAAATSSSSASSQHQDEYVCPCDCLLLGGSVVVNEAMLTGESVPQIKEAVHESIQDLLSTSNSGVAAADGEDRLNVSKSHKRHVVFGGTKVLMVTLPTQSSASSPSSSTSNSTSSSTDSAVIASSSSSFIPPAPNNGVPAFVLRTGFNSFQGKLVRTILLSTEPPGSNKEALGFIACLLVFAIAAAYTVLMEGLKDETRSRYKLLLNCILIITSVVPPELPMELSLAVNNALMALAKARIFCTEPFRIPSGGAVDVVCFDKTGTLTADEFVLLGIAGLPIDSASSSSTSSSSSSSSSSPSSSKALVPSVMTALVSGAQAPLMTRIVMGGCHELANVVGSGIVGDPMEKTVFAAAGWGFGSNVSASALNAGAGSGSSGYVFTSRDAKLRLVHRFAFSSARKRMACVLEAEGERVGARRVYYVVSKGAPEVLESRFRALPVGYSATHRHYAQNGCRVLALGWRIVETKTDEENQAVSKISRDDAESDLEFGGFLILQSPLKRDSLEVVRHLQDSSHRVVMITGDHVLTACHVASTLGIVDKRTLILTQVKTDSEPSSPSPSSPSSASLNPYRWESASGDVTLPFDVDVSPNALEALAGKYDLCLPGDAMDYYLHQRKPAVPAATFARLYRYVNVFARTMPNQKEHILAHMKNLGYSTMMCGDGTNDVGALKQAHVGVALLSSDSIQNKTGAVTKPRQPSMLQTMAANMKAQAETRAATDPTAKKAIEQVDALALALGELDDQDDKPATAKLGDASIAAPFTAKHASVNATVSIIRQGRATLVTTLQMFQILALNCLITAYSMSVLYLKGVKMGEAQMTISGLGVAAYFLLISRADPISRLSPERPHSRVFSWWMGLTVLGQFAIHLLSLMYAVSMALPHTPTDVEHRGVDSQFKPNVLNTTVYLVSTAMTVASFLANYRGRPFMPSLKEHNALYKSLLAGLLFVFILAAGILPEINAALDLVPFPSDNYRNTLVTVIALDVGLSVGLGRFLAWAFTIRPKSTLLRQRSDKVKAE